VAAITGRRDSSSFPKPRRRSEIQLSTLLNVISDLLTPFQYDYMLRAIWVSALIGGTCGFLSSFVTLKGGR